MTRKIIAICLVLLSGLAVGVEPAAGKTSHSSEQLHFSAEDQSVKTPIAIPPDVATVLEKDDLVRNALENEEPPRERLALSWFSASAIHLSSSRKSDLLVMAVGPLRGANVTMFWLFRQKDNRHQLVLRTGCLGLELKSRRRNGYRDVECAAVVMQKVSTILYRFDGTHYLQYASKLEDLK
jgi:hypothetical protein